MTGIALKTTEAGNFDFDLSSGAMVLAEVTSQNQALLLSAREGDYQEHPKVGVGLKDMVHDHELHLWKRKIVEQLEGDGQRIRRLQLTATGLTLDAEYR